MIQRGKTLRPPRILFVCDHGDTRRSMEKLLVRRGYSVALSPDAHYAVVLARTEFPDLLMLEIGGDENRTMMEGREIRARSPLDETTPIIAIVNNARITGDYTNPEDNIFITRMDDFGQIENLLAQILPLTIGIV